MASQDDDKPITGPKSNRPDYPWHLVMDRKLSPGGKMARWLADLFRKPVYWFRENVVERYRGPKYYWYHRKFNPALPIDECYLDDAVCAYEASKEYDRLRMVDMAVLNILRYRREHCRFWSQTKEQSTVGAIEACKDIDDTFKREQINFFIKYSDMPSFATAAHAYTKQKHRLIMERRIKNQQEKENNGNNNKVQNELY